MEYNGYNKLGSKSLKVMLISYSMYIIVIYTILLIGLTIFKYKYELIGNFYKYIIVILGVLLVFTELLMIVETLLHYRKYMFKITEYGIIIKSGIFEKSKEFIPYNIIKNIEIKQGPIMRKYNLSNIELNKINYSSTLKYINSNEVYQIKDKIICNKEKYMEKT